MLRRIKQPSKSRPEYKESLRSGIILPAKHYNLELGREKDSKKTKSFEKVERNLMKSLCQKEEQRRRLYNKLEKNKQERERRTFKNVWKELRMLLKLRVSLKRDIRSFEIFCVQ